MVKALLSPWGAYLISGHINRGLIREGSLTEGGGGGLFQIFMRRNFLSRKNLLTLYTFSNLYTNTPTGDKVGGLIEIRRV